MQEFQYLNTFFNMIYHNDLAVLRDFTSSYIYIQEFLKWLNQRHIEMPCLSHLTPQDLNMIKKCRQLKNIDHILHIDLSQEIESISQKYENYIHMIYIPGFDNINIYDLPDLENVCVYHIEESFSKEDLSFFDPFPTFLTALKHADQWPGILVFHQEKSVFHAIHSQKDMNQFIKSFHANHYFDRDNSYDSYFLQLSDLHIGKDKRYKGLMQLYSSIDLLMKQMDSHYPLKVLITGDLMESPNRKNMYLANDFMNILKKRYKADVTFILGNHDVIVHGFNFARMQKSKVIAYLLGENIKVLEKEKIVLIKMDTTSEGNLARGKVGQRQLDEIDDELEAIDHLEDYTLIVLLHHHVYPISKADFIKTKWHEKTFIHKIVETSKVLVDAPLLIQWLQKRHIHYVFHGHKHLPFFQKKDNKYYIAGGSATGGLKESRSRYISYNLVKYDHQKRQMKTCLIFYDDKAKAERQRVEVYLFEEDMK